MLIINERVDVALAAGADGVQLGSHALPVEVVRRLADRLTIGRSVHETLEAKRAADAGADFLLAGTIWPSATHPGRPGTGPGWLADLAASGVPVIGIGGVDAARARELREAGAYGAAVVRAVWDQAEPEAALRALLDAVHQRSDQESE
jgi:thiazole tautomerase (transcriptional regulator TenI)